MRIRPLANRGVLSLVSCLALGALGALGACSDDDSSCTFECTTEWGTRCDGQIVQTCRRSSQGCLTWVATTDCQQWGEFCHETGGAAQCTDECIDLCSSVGSTRCDQDRVQRCQMGTAGCLEWTEEADCTMAGDVCEEGTGDATCVQDCQGTPPGVPGGPNPADNAVDVDPETFSVVDWDNATGATRYEAYFGPCPAPAWPAISYVSVGSSERTGLTVEENGEYCWRVVAFNDEGCRTEGPEWSFTTSCTDPVAGAPTVRSSNQNFSPLTSGTYELTFSEPVDNVEASLTWTPVVGTGTMGTITRVEDGATYNVSFSGVAPGDSYSLTVGTGVVDHCGNALAAPVTIQITVDEQHGATCSDPQNVTGASFPYGLVGSFDTDVTGGSCETDATNTVFYTYTAAVTGLHRLSASNATSTYAYSRMAVFQGTGCNPYGAEVACVTASSKSINLDVDLVQGTTYLILFYTDGDTYTMENPTLSIEVMVTQPGDRCSEPVDLDSVSFPHSITGTFGFDPVGGSCDTGANNAVFYSYTAPSTGSFRIDTVNNTTTNAYTRLVVYEGTSCSPYGTELACVSSSAKTAMTIVDMTQGTTYLIQVYTDGDSYTMVDPEITIAPHSFQPGEACSTAVDLSSASFPHTLTGSFEYDFTGGSCDTASNNAVFYTFSPTTAGSYRIEAVNGTSGSAYSRLAVFATAACSPYGAELACVTSSTNTASTIVDMTVGTTYLIQFFTSSDSYLMENPQITIAPFTYQPGEACSTAVDISSASFPYDLTGTFDYDFVGGSCDTTATNAVFYRFTPETTGAYRINTENFTTTNAYARLSVFAGAGCGPYGPEVTCVTTSTKTAQAIVDMTGGTTYLIQVYTDGDSYTMVNPRISVVPHVFQAGEACSTAVDISLASFPHTLTGTFDYDFAGGSCDTTSNNAVFYTYTPTSNGPFRIDAVNATTTSASSRLAVFAGAGCSPYGAEAACVTTYDKTAMAVVEMTAGTPYLIQFYTSGDTYTMVNPQITIAPHVFQAGEACSTAVNLTGATFPYTLTGTFDYDFPGGTCDAEANNVVYFTYTANANGNHQIQATNATSTNAYSRLAVYETSGCNPYGTQLACVTSTTLSVGSSVSLTSGTTYLIQFYTDGDSYTMVNPQVTITAP